MFQNKSRGKIFKQIKISGTGSALGEIEISNQDLIQKYNIDTTSNWIEENLGIKKRYFAKEKTSASELGFIASQKALAQANIHPKDLDRILFCSTTGDWTSPATASRIQSLLSADCPAEDKQVACSSFIFGLDHAARLIETGLDHILVVASEIKSRFVNKSDKRFLPIFADGAGAIVLSKSNEVGLFCIELWTDGSKAKHIYTPAGGSELPASFETVEKNLHSVHIGIDGKEIFNDAVEVMTEISKQVLKTANLKISEIDLFIPHQANLSIMKLIAKNLSIPIGKTIITIDHTANIVSATIPYSLDFAFQTGRIKKGMNLLFVTAGGGYSAGANIYKVI